MTRQRLHEIVDLVLDYNDKADALNDTTNRIHLKIDGRYDIGYVWIYTGVGTESGTTYTYRYTKDWCIEDTEKDREIYDPNFDKAEAHIRALTAILEGGAE